MAAVFWFEPKSARIHRGGCPGAGLQKPCQCSVNFSKKNTFLGKRIFYGHLEGFSGLVLVGLSRPNKYRQNGKPLFWHVFWLWAVWGAANLVGPLLEYWWESGRQQGKPGIRRFTNHALSNGHVLDNFEDVSMGSARSGRLVAG